MMVPGRWFITFTGSSVNDSIDPDTFTLSYCSIDGTFAIVSALENGTLMARIDLRNAFCLIPIQPKDWNLLGFQWSNQFYIDTCLPFGLRSVPFLFNQFANVIHWFLKHNHGVCHLLHYLDNLTAGSPGSVEWLITSKPCACCVKISMHLLRPQK